MRTYLVLALTIGAACSKAGPAPKSGITRITYDVDLSRAVIDRANELSYDLWAASPGTSVTVDPAGVLTATPADPSKSAELATTIRSSYGDKIQARACAPDAPAGSRCFQISAAYATAIEQAALAQAAKTVKLRLDALKVPDATVTAKGRQLVVEVPIIDAATLEPVRTQTARTGRLEFLIVDEGAAVMQRIFQKVGAQGGDGAPTDPEAIEAGITAGSDEWRDQGKGEVHVDYYVRGPERAKLERYLARLAAADPAYAIPADRAVVFERMEGDRANGERNAARPLWRSYLVERRPALTGDSVKSAEMAMDPNFGIPTVIIDFDRQGARLLGEVTTRIIGKKLAITLDGIVKSAPVIAGAIPAGRAQIAMGGGDAVTQERDARELALLLRTGAMPAPLTEAAVDVVP